jgi:HSP20 family molecular chaperone IbpA
VLLEAELPGLDLKGLEIFVTGGNQLTIKGERKQAAPEKRAVAPAGTERGQVLADGDASLPGRSEKVEAKFENGVLTVRLTKHESARSRARSTSRQSEGGMSHERRERAEQRTRRGEGPGADARRRDVPAARGHLRDGSGADPGGRRTWVRPEDVDLRYDNGELLLHARTQARNADKQPLLGEYEVGDFHRVFRIDESIDSTKIEGECKNGVLTVHLPKVEAKKPRQINVKVV